MKTGHDWSNLQKGLCYSTTQSSSLLMSRKSAWLHLVKHLAERQKIIYEIKNNEQLEVWWPPGPPRMKSSSRLIYSPLIRRLSGLQFRLLMRSDRLTKTTLQTWNDNFISAEKLLVSHSHDGTDPRTGTAVGNLRRGNSERGVGTTE